MDQAINTRNTCITGRRPVLLRGDRHLWGMTVDYIITRNTGDFAESNIPAVTPEQFIDIITEI